MVATGWRALGWFLLALAAPATAWGGHERTIRPEVIVAAADAPFAERLAAQEVRRYVYLRTGKLLPITDKLGAEPAIVVGSKGQAVVKALPESGLNGPIQGLAVESYLTATTDSGPEVVLVVGGDPDGHALRGLSPGRAPGRAVLLHGDVVPDARVALAIRPTDERGKPLFDRRGIQPFHDFPEGPDWWNRDDYKAVLGQLPKLRMNFFGLHTYPEGGVGPEPLGLDRHARGRECVTARSKVSYPSRHFTTMQSDGRLGLPADEDERLPLRRGGDVRPRRLRRGLHGRHAIRGRRCRPSSATSCSTDMGGLLERRVHVRPAAGDQDLHRHGDAADDSHAGQGAAEGGGQGPGRSGRGAGALRGHVPADHGRCIRWTTTGSGRPRAGRGRGRRRSRSTRRWPISGRRWRRRRR